MNLKRQITRKEGRGTGMCGSVLSSLYCVFARRSIRWLIRRTIMKLEGGEFYSRTLRRIFKKHHGIDIGMYSYGCFDLDGFPSGTVIGRYCSFAKGVSILNGNHPLERISLHPFFYNPVLGVVTDLKIERSPLVIGHDVWIGRNALILPRVRHICNGAVIGAGAVVTKDVPDYAVVAGNPAEVIKYRFDRETIERLKACKWWDKDMEELLHLIDDFGEPIKEGLFEKVKCNS